MSIRKSYGRAIVLGYQAQRQFIGKRVCAPLSNDCKRRIELMPAERISLEAICRVMEIEPHGLPYFLNSKTPGSTPAPAGTGWP